MSNESGRREVFVEAFPDGGDRLQLSTDGGTEPNWSKSGQEIFYRNGPRLMSVRVTAGSPLAAAPPALLFTLDDASVFGPRGYAVAPEDQHFSFLRSPSPLPMPHRIHVVVNWIEEFKRRIGSTAP